jgi:hypothetical protein
MSIFAMRVEGTGDRELYSVRAQGAQQVAKQLFSDQTVNRRQRNCVVEFTTPFVQTGSNAPLAHDGQA